MPGVQGAPIGPKQPPFALFGDPSSFQAAATTQASDYDKIMAQYGDLVKSSIENPIKATPVPISQVSGVGSISPSTVSYNPLSPQLSQYKQSSDVTGSLADLSNLATTGGYSAADIQNIRERSISPIRSIYANAQQNIERQRALSGGYSPNFNATTAQLSRDEASQIGDTTTAANAAIAQNVASNKIAATPAYASASATANAAQTAADQRNTDIINQINELNAAGNLEAGRFNAANALQAGQFNTSTAAAIAEANANRATQTGQFNTQASLEAAKANRGTALSAIQGKASLYGTTPALTNTFGNQVTQATQLGQNQQQINNNRFGQIGNLTRYMP